MGKNDEPLPIIAAGDYVKMRFHYLQTQPIGHPLVGITIWDKNEHLIAAHSSQESGATIPLQMGKGYFEIEYPSLKLTGGSYYVRFLISDRGTQAEDLVDVMDKAKSLEVEAADYYNSGVINRRRNCAIIDARFVY